MKVGHGIWLSDRVRELLDEGTLRQLFDIVEEDLKGEWLATPPDAVATREQIYCQLHALSRVNLKMQVLLNELMFRKDD